MVVRDDDRISDIIAKGRTDLVVVILCHVVLVFGNIMPCCAMTPATFDICKTHDITGAVLTATMATANLLVYS